MKLFARVGNVFYGQNNLPIRTNECWAANIVVMNSLFKCLSTQKVVLGKQEPTVEQLEEACRIAIKWHKDEVLFKQNQSTRDRNNVEKQIKANRFNGEILIKGKT